MIALQLKTNTGATCRAYFNGTYSNAVDYYLGRVLAQGQDITGQALTAKIVEVFEIPTTKPEPYYEQQ